MSANLGAALIAQNSYPGLSVRISICEMVSTQLIYIPLTPAFSLKGILEETKTIQKPWAYDRICLVQGYV